jgi:hypothetical protein
VTVEEYLSRPTADLEQALGISRAWLGHEGKTRVVLFKKVLRIRTRTRRLQHTS